MSSRRNRCTPAPARSAAWAQALPQHGVENLHRVSMSLYRSAQPQAGALPALQAIGIRTIVSLRSFNADDRIFDRAALRLIRVPINTWHIADRHIVGALSALRDAERDGTVLLHCLHGADRTGVVIAAYRMVFQGWTKSAAREEMLDGGFGYHTLWRNIPAYLERVDPGRIARLVDAVPHTG